MTLSQPIRVLVLGGAGMLGHLLLRHLRQCPALSVRWTSRRGKDGGIPFDIQEEPARLHDWLACLGPIDYLINCIAVLHAQIEEHNPASIQRAETINGAFPHRLAEAAAAYGARVLHVSTDGVFAVDADPCVESTPAVPANVYGRTKLQGEVSATHVLNIRCSLIGPASANGRGLLEWLCRQPVGARLSGFVDHRWTGCTTRQVAELCRRLIADDLFAAAVSEGSVHHFCPCAPVSKCELLQRLAALWRPDIEVCPTVSGRPVTRRLDTEKKTLHRIFPKYAPLEPALLDLAARPNLASRERQRPEQEFSSR